jgi:peptide/nickel transport system permease protein
MRRLLLREFVMVAVVVGVIAALFLVAARNFMPSVSGAGVAGSAIRGWDARTEVAPFGTVTMGFDLAAQAGESAPALVLLSALNSAFLVLLAAAAALTAGIPLGFWLAVHAPRRLVVLIKTAANVGVAFPAFFVAFLLQVLAVELTGRSGRTVLPVYGFGLDAHLVIPVIALALAPFAYVVRLVAISATELNARDFVRTARAKGLGEAAVIYRHIAPNMFGAIGEAGLGALRFVLGGLVIVEYLLVWPGLGILALRAANVQDLPLFLVSASLLALLFFAVDIGLDLVTNKRGSVSG